MHIESFKLNGKPYLRLAESYKTRDMKYPAKRVVYNIGPLDKFDDQQPDYLERLRQSFALGKPLIPELEQYVSTKVKPKTYTLTFTEGTNDCVAVPKLFIDLIFNAYMEELGLRQLFARIKSDSKFQYDLLGFIKLIVYGRILKPASKYATIEQNNDYYDPILKDEFNANNIYDTLDVVHQHQTRIFKTINKALMSRVQGRDTSVIFYDVTNFYFEIEQNDQDLFNSEGVVIEEGLRKRGHSKENRQEPIVQVGLFMDKDSVPIGIRTFSGNTADTSTMQESTSTIITPMGYERYIYCADRGLCAISNLVSLLEDGQGYLLSKSIKKSSKEDKEWIKDPKGYEEEKNELGEVIFKFKSCIKTRKFKKDDGTEISFEEKVVAFWSLDYYKRELHMMESFYNFLEKLEVESKSFTLNTSQIRKIKPFLKDEILEQLDPRNDHENIVTNESQNSTANDYENNKPKRKHRLTQEERDQKIADKKAENARIKAIRQERNKRMDEQLKDSETTKTMIDWDKVNRYRDFAGYYQIITSEKDKDVKEIISTYRELTQIENRFRTMKGTLSTRPVFVRLANHIDGHMVLCTMALIIFALIQNKIKQSKLLEKEPESKWWQGMDANRLQAALNNFKVEELAQQHFRFIEHNLTPQGKDLEIILKAFNINLPKTLFTPGDLRALRGKIKVLE